MPRLVLALLLMSSVQWAQQYRAFWADAFHEGYKTPAQVDQLVENALTAKANAIFMEARVRSNSYFRQSLEGFAEDSAVPAGFDPLEYLIQKAHARGIEVHAWYVVYPLWRTGSPPQNPQHLYHLHGPPAAGDERWLNVSSAGVETLGLDPGHPGVLPYLIDVFLEPVKRYDVDGIHLDYVRYPEDADYGYNRASIERYSRQNNKVGVPSRADGAWNQWRRDQVTALVRQLYLRVQQLRPGVKVSAATITWGNGPLTDAEYRGKDAYGYVFQDWRGWLEEGILDLSVPMNYFVETKYATYLDRWAEYQKNRQYGRGYVNGLGNYLNTLPQTLAQLDRVLRPSSLGNTPLGVCFYSYASTRSEDPAQRPNPEFYQAIGEYFKEQVAVPELPWKTRPVKGHLMGRLEVNGGEKWWADGVMVRLAGREGGEQSRRTDASGFFGWVDLAPGEYKAQIESNGRMVFESDWVRVEAGRVAEIPARLNGDQLEATLPALDAGEVTQAAPGGLLKLRGRNLAPRYAAAEAVPLPREMAGTMVVVNGLAAPLFEIGEDFVVIQVPYARADQWIITARRGGTESRPLVLASVEALPEIVEVRRSGGDGLEIFATGLGMTDPPALSGAGGSAEEPYHRTILPVRVLISGEQGEVEIEPAYAGLQPWIPARYLVQAKLPAGVSVGQVRIKVGEALSAPVAF